MIRPAPDTTQRTGGSIAVLGAGFIGMNLIRRLIGEGMDLSVLDRNGPPANLAPSVRWVQGEFADPDAVARAVDGAATAFHLLSSTVPGDEHVDVIRELSDNTFTTLTFLDICERAGVKRVVFASSSSVYGVQSRTPIPECAPTDPISSHGIQKLCIEKYLLLRRYHGSLDVRIARLSNPYGPGQPIYGRQGFVAMTIGHILLGEAILLRDAGRPVRDFIYIDDVTQALYRLATVDGVPPVVNIGSGAGHSLDEVLRHISGILAREIETITGEPRRSDIPVSVLDISLAAERLGFTPATSLADGLRLTLRHHGLPT